MSRFLLLLLIPALLILAGCRMGGATLADRYEVDLMFRPDGVRIEVARADEDVPPAQASVPMSVPTTVPPSVPTVSAPAPTAIPQSDGSSVALPEGTSALNDVQPGQPLANMGVPDTLPRAAANSLPEPIAGAPGRSPAQLSAVLAQDWFRLALDLVKMTPGYSPPVAARAYGYLGIVLYETVQPGLERHVSLVGQLNELSSLPVPYAGEPVDWALAANRSLAQTMRYLFPTAPAHGLLAIDALEERYFGLLHGGLDDGTLARSAAWGDAVAHAIYVWSQEDGGHAGYARNYPAEYLPQSGNGLWVATPPDFSRALQPYWGDNRPFVLPSGAACPAPAPPAYSESPNSEFYAHALEVYEVGRARTPEQLEIAQFWADDPGATATPGGHWVSILTQVLAEQEATLALAAQAYAQLGIVLNDAFITCWYTKYDYNVIRPITYIQNIIDPNWNMTHSHDPVGTPPFPEYTSGHSVQSGAAAAILTSLFGPDYAFADATHEVMGLSVREFPSFVAAAEEAAISRLYGGIHFRPAIEAGLAQGQCVADQISRLQFTLP